MEPIITAVIVIIAFICGIFISRWVFRIDYICERLSAISNNLRQIREIMDQKENAKPS